MTTITLINEINSLPKELRDQVANFVAFLKSKQEPKPTLEKRQAGFLKGKIKLADDFDEPLEELKDYTL